MTQTDKRPAPPDKKPRRLARLSAKLLAVLAFAAMVVLAPWILPTALMALLNGARVAVVSLVSLLYGLGILS